MGWVLDLDGVVWLGDEPVPGAAEAVARLRAAGEEVVFCTNNSSEPRAVVEAKLARQGIPAGGSVVGSAQAAATLVAAGERVLVCGGPGIVEAVTAVGAQVVDGPPADVVMVGFDRGFDYAGLDRASAAVRAGARLIGTNDDATYPTADRILPGGGALLAAVETASGVEAVVAGKPYRPMADLLRARLGPRGVMVGDRPDTDGRFAAALGYPFALVLSGVCRSAEGAVPAPDHVAPDLAALVDRHLAQGRCIGGARRPRPQQRSTARVRTIASTRGRSVGFPAMPQNDVLKRYLDAGLAFTAVTQARAEALVKDLVKAGEVQADQAREAVTDLLERSRKNSEKLLETVRDEVKTQITNLGLASKADLDKMEARLATLVDTATAPVRKATAPVRTAAKATAKATATKAPAVKKATKQAGAKKASTKKAPAKKTAAKKQA
jgi:4-nitrophenyl phosphatase